MALTLVSRKGAYIDLFMKVSMTIKKQSNIVKVHLKTCSAEICPDGKSICLLFSIEFH